MDPNVGQLVNNKYRLVRLIGDGGMGSVFEARHELLGTTVALKFLHTALARRKGLVDRFLQEAQVSARIRSPHVVRVTDVERTPEGLAYMVMEYVEGSTLQELYEQLYRMGKRLSYGEAFELVFQMLDGVGVAHAMGIVHRDLKPDNVMLTKDGSNRTLVKILDFGIAKLRASGEMDRGLTKPGVVMGTPEYMAPEQAFSADKVDARADIFSLGVMFYEMLAGRRPVGGENAMAIAAQYLEGNITQLRTLVPTIAPPLAKAVHKAMAPRPENRFSSVEDLRSAIEPFAPEGPGAEVGTAAGAGKSAPERSSGALGAALEAQRGVPRTAPSGGPEPEAGLRQAHTPLGPPALAPAGDAGTKRGSGESGPVQSSDEPISADREGGSPAAKLAGEASERPADSGAAATADEARGSDEAQGAAEAAARTARGLGAATPRDPTPEPAVVQSAEGRADSPKAAAESSSAPSDHSGHLVDATVAMGAGDSPAGAARETAEATPFLPGAQAGPPPDAPLAGDSGGEPPGDADARGADRPGATVVGEPFEATPFPPAGDYDVADPGPGGFLGSGTQAAAPFQAGVGGVPAPQGPGGSPEYGVEAQIPFGGPAPAQERARRSRGPSLLSVLMLAGAVSALVVGGVYAAQEYGSDDDDHGPRGPATEVTTTTSTVPTEPLPTTTTTEAATSSTTTTTSTTWSQPTTTRTPTTTAPTTTTRTPTTTAPTTTTSTTSTPPIWTLPTALPTVTLPPFTFPGPRPSTVPPPTSPTTTPTSTGTGTSTRPPILRLPLPKPKPVPGGG